MDLRDADLSDRQLRDDLMTMLIAGHETTAAVLTWALFSLVQHPEELAHVVEEIDSTIGDATPGLCPPELIASVAGGCASWLPCLGRMSAFLTEKLASGGLACV